MVFSQNLNTRRTFKWLANALIRLRVCAGWSEPLLVATYHIVGNLMDWLNYAHSMQVCYRSVHISTSSRNVVTVQGHPMFNSHGINRCKRYEPSNKSMKSKTYADSSITSKQMDLDNGNAQNNIFDNGNNAHLRWLVHLSIQYWNGDNLQL